MNYTDDEKAVFEFLFELQDSGNTNMYGYAAYIIREPRFSKIGIVLAEDLVLKWMANYDKIKAEMACNTIVFH